MRIAETIRFIGSLIVILIVAFGIRASIIEPYKIPSSSMEPTLEIGDYILVNKLSYGLRLLMVDRTLYNYDTPKRKDVVVFSRPDNPDTLNEDESDLNIIKRVVGIPGDKIEVKGTTVLINGKALEEDYARWQQGGLKDFPETTVPKGHIFLLGDNRDHSKDSRFWKPSHFLDIKLVKGRAFLISWNSGFSFDRMFKIIR